MKKGEVTLAAIVLIVIIFVFLGWMMKEGWKECRSNEDCKDTQYCGSDFSCHDLQVIEKPAPRDSTTETAWVIGIAIIIAALIIKWDTLFKSKGNHHANHGGHSEGGHGHDAHAHDEHSHHEHDGEPSEGPGYRSDKRGMYEEQTGDEEKLNKGHDHH